MERSGSGVHYRDEGTGSVVLFLHAFPLGLSMWDDQARAFAASHRVVRFDDRGFGGTPAGAEPLAMDTIADDAAALLDHLGIERAVVWGCSMGGYASLAFVRRHPERLRGLVLQDTRAGADTDEGRAKRTSLAERVIDEGPRAAADAFVPGLLGRTTHETNPDLVERVRATILANPSRGIANALLGMRERPDSFPTLPRIRVPTLVLCGEEDVLTPPAESEALHRGIAGSRLALIAGAGHLCNMEQPDAVGRALAAFLREVS
jgi:pimeloyl-ACP methyl ester carboxylesterase